MPVEPPSSGTPLPAAVLGPARLGDLVTRFAERPRLWLPHVRYTTAERYYTRLEHSEAHEVWLLTWLPGQGTEIHDHGGSGGAFAPVRGELTERTFPPAPGPERPGPRRLLPGGTRAFGPSHVHQVANEAATPAVSVHAYSPPLAEMAYYRRLPSGRLVTDRVDGAGA